MREDAESKNPSTNPLDRNEWQMPFYLYFGWCYADSSSSSNSATIVVPLTLSIFHCNSSIERFGANHFYFGWMALDNEKPGVETTKSQCIVCHISSPWESFPSRDLGETSKLFHVDSMHHFQSLIKLLFCFFFFEHNNPCGYWIDKRADESV